MNGDQFTAQEIKTAIETAKNYGEIQTIAKVVGMHVAKGWISDDERKELEELMTEKAMELKSNIKGRVLQAGKSAVAHFTSDEMRTDYAKVQRLARRVGMVPTAAPIGFLEGLIAGVVIPLDELAKGIRK